MSIAIELDDVSKRYRQEWILRQVDLHLRPGGRYAITGPNGTGKSTLLRILSGHLSPSRGSRRYVFQQSPLPEGEVYRHLSYAAPYVDLIEEFTLREAIDFQLTFKPLRPPLRREDLFQRLGFDRAIDKQVRYFSSGMKQRLKLLLALAADTALVLLDEPTTNLDRQGIAWYHQLVRELVLPHQRLIVVASNVADDFSFCTEQIDVTAFKRPRQKPAK